jgi:hypothetical protein
MGCQTSKPSVAHPLASTPAAVPLSSPLPALPLTPTSPSSHHSPQPSPTKSTHIPTPKASAPSIEQKKSSEHMSTNHTNNILTPHSTSGTHASASSNPFAPPIRLVGDRSNPILLQILQVVCSEKSYHESIHRIQIEKVNFFSSRPSSARLSFPFLTGHGQVLQKENYISCEIVGEKCNQIIFLSYLCLLSKAVPEDNQATPDDFVLPLIPLEESAMVSSITDGEPHLLPFFLI